MEGLLLQGFHASVDVAEKVRKTSPIPQQTENRRRYWRQVFLEDSGEFQPETPMWRLSPSVAGHLLCSGRLCGVSTEVALRPWNCFLRKLLFHLRSSACWPTRLRQACCGGPPVTGRSRLPRRLADQSISGANVSSSSLDNSEKTRIYLCVSPLPFPSRVQKNKPRLVLPFPPSHQGTQGV